MQRAVKRLFDFAVAGWLLVMLAPLLGLLALLVHRQLGSPVLFRQTRIGQGERPFSILKFRTMLPGDAPDAERLTRFGRFLRATSLDELPELWNVFTGKMSFVGPRPLLPQYLGYYREDEQLRHRMRPGLTGLAQVSGRNGLGWDARLARDAEYVRRFSLLLDAEILLRTVWVVLARQGVSAEGHATMHRLDEERKHTSVWKRHRGIMSERIFLSPPHMGDNEQRYVSEAFASNYIAPLGPFVDRFEQEFAAYIGIPHCVALSSGTGALHLALRGMNIGTGDRVYASSLTFIGSIAPILYQGATPVFIDADDKSWNMDIGLLADALARDNARNALPKAVIPTDLYGQSVDVDAMRALCDRYGVKLLIDAAESVGTTYKNKHAGYGGDAAAFSFNGNKIITTSGGGMLASHDKTLIDSARFLSQQARDPAPHYEHTAFGYNYRMSNILAAIGCGQLEMLDARVARRRAIHAHYRAQLGALPGLHFIDEMAYGKSNRWLTVMLVDEASFGVDRETIRRVLEKKNIEARPVWKPMHLQPVFAGAEMVGGAVSEALFRDGLCLPSGTAMEDATITRICDIIRSTGTIRAQHR